MSCRGSPPFAELPTRVGLSVCRTNMTGLDFVFVAFTHVNGDNHRQRILFCSVLFCSFLWSKSLPRILLQFNISPRSPRRVQRTLIQYPSNNGPEGVVVASTSRHCRVLPERQTSVPHETRGLNPLKGISL